MNQKPANYPTEGSSLLSPLDRYYLPELAADSHFYFPHRDGGISCFYVIFWHAIALWGPTFQADVPKIKLTPTPSATLILFLSAPCLIYYMPHTGAAHDACGICTSCRLATSTIMYAVNICFVKDFFLAMLFPKGSCATLWETSHKKKWKHYCVKPLYGLWSTPEKCDSGENVQLTVSCTVFQLGDSTGLILMDQLCNWEKKEILSPNCSADSLLFQNPNSRSVAGTFISYPQTPFLFSFW